MTKFGLILAGFFPLYAVLALGLGSQLPGCNLGGSGGAASGCYLLGIDLSIAVQYGTVSLLASLLAVPVGAIIALIGLFLPPKLEDR